MRLNAQFSIVLIAVTALGAGEGLSEILKLEKGTMALGGKIAMPFEFDYKGESKWKLEFEPTFDYFISPSFSVGGGLNLAYTPIDSNATDRGPVVWGFQAGFKYYLKLSDRLFGFTGFSLYAAQNDLALVSVRWGFEVPIGLLLALNENVGVVFNVPVRVHCRSTTFFSKFIVNPGYFGVAAFF